MPTSSSAKKNGPVSRKRVGADPSSMKRATGGSAFTHCDSCNKDIPIATADMHDCLDVLSIKASLDKMGKDAADKAKALEKSKSKNDVEKVGAKRKEGGKVREKKTKRSKPEKDPNKPKRPNTAYFLFLSDFRNNWRKEHPTDKMMIGDVAKAAAAKWKVLSEEEKKPYIADAAEKKAVYDKAVRTYKGEKDDKGHDAAESPPEGGEANEEEEAAEEGGDESLVED